MADISKLLGAGGGGGMAAAMGRMGGLGGMGGMSGLMGGGMGGMNPGYRPPSPMMPGGAPGGPGMGGGDGLDPRLQGMTPEDWFKPGGELAYRFGGMGALTPVQQYKAEQRMGASAPAGTNFGAMAPYFMASQGGQQPGQPSPLRGMFRR